jgi:FMN phosphatase YigB (HAD superfamily)
MIRAICFDFDGVILIANYFSDRLPAKYPTVTSKQILDVLKTDWKNAQLGKKTMHSVWKKHLSKWNIPMNLDDMFKFWFDGESLNKEILTLIKSLRSDYKIILLSNNPKERVDYYNKQNKLYSYFDGVVISSDIGDFKTSSKASKKVVKLAGVSIDEIAVVDNDLKDLAKYKTQGFTTIKYTNTNNLRKQLNIK